MPDYHPTDLRVWRVEAGLTVKRAASLARVSKTVVLQTEAGKSPKGARQYAVFVASLAGGVDRAIWVDKKYPAPPKPPKTARSHPNGVAMLGLMLAATSLGGR